MAALHEFEIAAGLPGRPLREFGYSFCQLPIHLHLSAPCTLHLGLLQLPARPPLRPPAYPQRKQISDKINWEIWKYYNPL